MRNHPANIAWILTAIMLSTLAMGWFSRKSGITRRGSKSTKRSKFEK
jgi:hypothetical protein